LRLARPRRSWRGPDRRVRRSRARSLVEIACQSETDSPRAPVSIALRVAGTWRQRSPPALRRSLRSAAGRRCRTLSAP
jgi:hypothetical protein